ncbi:MAG TPA: hypothetical protein VHM27_12690, partial [Rhizomicrobium sp.]|nr:hypothetical protein [Rhizomicrobium sp.]
AGVTGEITVTAGMVSTADPQVAAWLRAQSGKGDVGREIPPAEVKRFAGMDVAAAFEPAPHVVFSSSGAVRGKPSNAGTHGFWPTRPDYHSIFALSGPGIKAGKLGEIEMISLRDRFAKVLDLNCR